MANKKEKIMKNRFPGAGVMIVLGGCLFGFAADNAFGEDSALWVGEGNVFWKNVPTAETADAPIVTGANGILYKTGEGKWTLPSSYLSGTTLPFALSVLEGAVSFDGAELPAASVVPPSAVQEAYLWLDVSRADSLLDGDGAVVSGGFVERWCDARETTPGTTSERCFAKAMHTMPDHGRSDAQALSPELTTYEGKTALYFGGTTSGRWMQWCTPQGSDAADTVPIKNIFAVHGVAKSFGWLFGSTTGGTRSFHVTSYGKDTSWGAYWSASEPDFTAELLNARTYLDGVRIDGFSTLPKAGLQLVDVDFCRGHGRANNFFNDNNCGASANYRQGGDYLCEVLVFTNALSDVARMQVESYLLAKWCAKSVAAEVSLAKGTSLSFASSGAGTVREVPDGLAVSGAGAVVAVGAGDVALPRSVTDRTNGAIVRSEDGVTVLVERPATVLSQAGETVTAEVKYGGQGVTVSSAAAGEIVKEGSQEIALAELPADVKKLSVKGGTLRLNACTLASAEGSDADAVAITNSSFEDGGTSADNHRFTNGETFQGWTCRRLRTEYNDCLYTILCNGQYPNAGYKFLGTPPDGTHCLMFSMNVEASTPVSLTKPGVYELSFWIGGRNDGAYSNAYQQDVFLTSGDGTVITNFAGRSISASSTAFSAFSFIDLRFHLRVVRFRVSEAGDYRLHFAPSLDYGTTDREVLVDAVRMRRIPEPESEPGAWPLPNGDFERAAFAVSGVGNPLQFSAGATVPGWTVTRPDAGVVGGGFVTRAMQSGGRCKPYYNDSRYPAGGEVLFLAETNCSLSTTFRPPKGRWRLRAASARRAFDNISVGATVRIGGVDTSLGSIRPAAAVFGVTEWPSGFEVDGETDVSLTLDCSFELVSAMVRLGVWLDDFRLVPHSLGEGPELVTDGSFESGSGWTFVKPEHAASGDSLCQRDNLLNRTKTDGKHWGWDPPDGTYAALVTQDGTVSRTVNFPSAGLYRLSCMARCRADLEYGGGQYGGYWRHQMHVELEKGDVTREIGAYQANSSNFVHYAWNFRVQDPGEHTLRFRGVAETAKGCRMSFVDTVSVKAIGAAEMPDIPESLTVDVTSGSKLHLDFDGMGTVGKVRLGGASRSGVISSERFPDFVTGPGCLYVEPRGAVLIFR